MRLFKRKEKNTVSPAASGSVDSPLTPSITVLTPRPSAEDRIRNELFAGYDRTKARSGRFLDGPVPFTEAVPGAEIEEDIEGIKKQTRFVKEESVKSTRNAIQLARQAEEVARSTLTRVEVQSEKLENAQRDFDLAKGHVARATDRTDELRQLNRSIFRPVIAADNEAKHIQQAIDARTRYDERRRKREANLRDSHYRLEVEDKSGRIRDEEGLSDGIESRSKLAEGISRKYRRHRFQFEATESDDELEDELERNLGEVEDAAGRLIAIGLAINEELSRQIGTIDRMDEQAEDVGRNLEMNTNRLKKIR